jgi:hypothetical protein
MINRVSVDNQALYIQFRLADNLNQAKRGEKLHFKPHRV